jgi:phosphoglycolate phosphatase-like HAD superfamily hydrolase
MVDRVLILDFDGVITDLDVDWELVYREVSKLSGYTIDGLLTFWENCYGTELFNSSSEIIEKHELEAISKATLYDDIKPALKSFEGPIYIASMQSHKALEAFFNRYDLKHFIKEALGRNNFGIKRRQIQYIINKEQGNKDIIFVDDLLRNGDDCSDLGINFILFNRKKGDNLVKVVERIKNATLGR